MTVENGQPSAADELSMITDLRAGEAPAETPNDPPAASPAPAPAPAPANDPSDPPQDDDDAEAEARRTALLREIAMDPGLTQQYVQSQFTPTAQQPGGDEPPELPFDEFTFDRDNPEHQKALIAAQLQEVGGPMFEMLERISQRFEMEDQQRQQQQIEKMAEHANQKTVEFLDTFTPGFADITEKISKGETLSAVERAVFNEAVNAESAMLQQAALEIMQANQGQVNYQQAYNYALHNVQIRAHIAQQIGPELKKYAKDLGLVAQPKTSITPEQKQVMKQEAYVESSNAVPANAAGAFEKALESGDEFQMIRALRAK